MRIQVFNVAHGFCAWLVADNGNVMLFDCGHNDETGFRPSEYLKEVGCTGIETFFIMNYDDDHVSDLQDLRETLPIKLLHRNKTISPDALKKLKEKGGPLTDGLNAAIQMARNYSEDAIELPEYPDLTYSVFHNDYPAFEDTNNLSLVVFIHYDGLGIVFPGDLQKAGWDELLKKSDFLAHLKRVNIFVASHHGRESGYCESVFDYCEPDVVIISDEEIKYETQEEDYRKWARGLPMKGLTGKRYVLTTRSDGMITIRKELGEPYWIRTG